MRGAIPPLLQYVFMAWCLVKHRDNFLFLVCLYVVICLNGKESSRICRDVEVFPWDRVFSVLVFGGYPFRVSAVALTVFTGVFLSHSGRMP
jgi:hypothetical protein